MSLWSLSKGHEYQQGEDHENQNQCKSWQRRLGQLVDEFRPESSNLLIRNISQDSF
jgi:hypothetical protein